MRTTATAAALCVLLVSIVTPTLLAQNVARYAFSNESLASSDTDPGSVATELAAFNSTMFWTGIANTYLCLTADWNQSAEQGPFNGSQNYLEFSVAPNALRALYLSSLDLIIAPSLDRPADAVAVYADEDPGPGGDNFQTKLDEDLDIFDDLGNVSLDLSGISFLQNVEEPVTIRLYFWNESSSGVGSTEICRIDLRGQSSVACVGVQAFSMNLGASCNLALDPTLTVDPPILGTIATATVNSAFPNALVLLYASLPPVVPYQVPGLGCTIYVDVLPPMNNLFLLGKSTTDANGNHTFAFPIPAVPGMMGAELILQARICAPTGPPGPLAPDWVSNGVGVRAGCP